MSNQQIEKIIRKLEGDGPIEKHIILLKMIQALEKAPDFGDSVSLDAHSPQRKWLSVVGALLSRLGIHEAAEYRSAFSTLAAYWKPAIQSIKGQVSDAIEKIKLELELDGRSEIGSAYQPGDVYRFYADLKAIINSAKKEVLVIDPFFDGNSFDAYLSTLQEGITVQILAERYSNDISAYISKHQTQYKSIIELRRSKELHDRLVIVDNDDCWIMGGSIKDAGTKATYLIPLAAPLSENKRTIYSEIWGRANKIILQP
jgi:hypothetical protein